MFKPLQSKIFDFRIFKVCTLLCWIECVMLWLTHRCRTLRSLWVFPCVFRVARYVRSSISPLEFVGSVSIVTKVDKSPHESLKTNGLGCDRYDQKLDQGSGLIIFIEENFILWFEIRTKYKINFKHFNYYRKYQRLSIKRFQRSFEES